MPIKIVFLGSRPLGHFALAQLERMKNVQIIGRIVRQRAEEAWWTNDPFDIANAPVVDIRDLREIDFDLGISVNYWKIIDEDIIARARLGFLNFHHSYFLSQRGLNITTHALLNARATNRWYHGTSLHYMVRDLDSGPIIASESCPITERDTAWTLFNRVDRLAMRVYRTWIPRVLEAQTPTVLPAPGAPLFDRRALPDKEITDLGDPLKIYDHVRAFEFPGFEPAFIRDSGRKLHLTITGKTGSRVFVDARRGRRVYVMPAGDGK